MNRKWAHLLPLTAMPLASAGLYPRNWAGLVARDAAAIAFFRNSVPGNMGFAAVLFGGFALLETHVTSLRENRGFSVAAR